MTEQEVRTAESSQDSTELRELAAMLFHRLWSKDVGTEGYDKQTWKALQKVLWRLGVKV